MHSAPLRKKSDALRSSARSGYLMRRLRHAVSRPCDAISYLRCPGAIYCPARRALRAVLQPRPVLRRADRRRVEPTALRLRRLGPPAGCGGCSVRGKRRRCLCAFGCHTVALVLFPEVAAPASASPASRFALAHALAVGQGTCLPGHGASVGSVSRQARRLT